MFKFVTLSYFKLLILVDFGATSSKLDSGTKTQYM